MKPLLFLQIIYLLKGNMVTNGHKFFITITPFLLSVVMAHCNDKLTHYSVDLIVQ